MGDPVTQCWCVQPGNKAELQCSKCKKYIHYECLGLSVTQLSHLINREPGLYLCKICAPKVTKANREAFIKNNPGNSIFEFSEAMLAVANGSPTPSLIDLPTLEKVIDERFALFETQIVSSVVDVTANISENVRSYASVAQTAIKSAASQPSTVSGKPEQRNNYRADPKRSILVSKLWQPLRFAPKSIKTTFSQIWPDSVARISHAKLLNSGKLLIEARSTKDRDDLLETIPPNCYGDGSSAGAMDSQPSSAKWLMIAGLDVDISIQDARAMLASEYPTSDNVSLLPLKQGARSRLLKCRVGDLNEYSRLLNYGLFGSFCHYRAHPLVDRPRRCYNCHRFGHVSAVCRSPKRCCNCGSENANHSDPCSEVSKCCNCSGDHRADSLQCPTFVDRYNIMKDAARNA